MTEKLAAYAHKAWSGWMQYLFEKSIENEDGTITIPKEFAERWKRQANTEYTDLSEGERESDRDEARTMIKIMCPHALQLEILNRE